MLVIVLAVVWVVATVVAVWTSFKNLQAAAGLMDAADPKDLELVSIAQGKIRSAWLAVARSLLMLVVVMVGLFIVDPQAKMVINRSVLTGLMVIVAIRDTVDRRSVERTIHLIRQRIIRDSA